MKNLFTEPTIEVKLFAAENIVTASEQGTADNTVTEATAAVTVDVSTLTLTF